MSAIPPDISLRPLEQGDAERILDWVRDPLISRNMGLRNPPTLARTEEWIRKTHTDDTLFARAIVVEGEHVGNVVVDQLDRHAETARLSIYLGASSVRGRGICSRAMRLGAEQAAATLKVKKIWVHVAVDNVPSTRCCLGAGFQIEGVLKRHYYTNEGVVDCFTMGLFF